MFLKKKLKDFIDIELKMIDNDKVTNKDVLYGMKSAYLIIRHIFCGGKH